MSGVKVRFNNFSFGSIFMILVILGNSYIVASHSSNLFLIPSSRPSLTGFIDIGNGRSQVVSASILDHFSFLSIHPLNVEHNLAYTLISFWDHNGINDSIQIHSKDASVCKIPFRYNDACTLYTKGIVFRGVGYFSKAFTISTMYESVPLGVS